MELREIDENGERAWDDFILASSPESFLQSYAWGKFQMAVGRSVRRFAVEERGELLAVALAVEHHLPLGFKYWYLPRGPVLPDIQNEEGRSDLLGFLLPALSREAKLAGAVFLRMDPALGKSSADFLVASGLRKISGSVQPQDTLTLDITKSEDELLGAMKPKTRYNLRLAERKGVEVSVSDGKGQDFEKFWSLIQETSERDGIVSHDREYYRQMLLSLDRASGLECRLYLATYQEEAIAANLVLFFGPYAVYLHGASSNRLRNLMAPYLLQWRQMEDARARGCRIYDFWGITVDNANPRWAGITRFKQGFAGTEVSYAGVFDLPLRAPLYEVYRLLMKMRRP